MSKNYLPLLVTQIAAKENFLLIKASTHEVLLEIGPHLEKRVSPCSTFKIALSLMGYDGGILKDETASVWDFQTRYDDFVEIEEPPKLPLLWMQCSPVSYSKLLASQLGREKMQYYLKAFEYGNQDLSGGPQTSCAWINSSLKISPKEQVEFIEKIVQGTLPISGHALDMTKALLFKEALPEGGKLFGKTGWSGPIHEENGTPSEIGWFVGWVEYEGESLVFAYHIQDRKIDLSQRIPRVKQLLSQAK